MNSLHQVSIKISLSKPNFEELQINGINNFKVFSKGISYFTGLFLVIDWGAATLLASGNGVDDSMFIML